MRCLLHSNFFLIKGKVRNRRRRERERERRGRGRGRGPKKKIKTGSQRKEKEKEKVAFAKKGPLPLVSRITSGKVCCNSEPIGKTTTKVIGPFRGPVPWKFVERLFFNKG